MNNIDSSLIYANYALEEEMSSGGSAISDNLHLYYRNIGDIYSKGLDYHQSSSAYRRAYFYALRTMNSMQKKRLREIERQYNENLNKTELEKRATQRRIFILLEIIIMLSLIIIVGLLFYMIVLPTNRLNVYD